MHQRTTSGRTDGFFSHPYLNCSIVGNFSFYWKFEILNKISESDPSQEIPTLFDTYINIKKNYLNFIIWDATCHLMRELAGKENHGVFKNPPFDFSFIEKLAKVALQTTQTEVEILKVPESKRHLIAGIAIWNLFLPQAQGGCFPDNLYKEFLQKLNQNYHQFYETYRYEIAPDSLEDAFINFRNFAREYCHLEMKSLSQQSENKANEVRHSCS